MLAPLYKKFFQLSRYVHENVQLQGAEYPLLERGMDRMLTIIELKARPDGGHGLQSQSHRTECWLEGWTAVPEELTEAVWECGGYCELTLDGKGNLTAITPIERPAQPERPPTGEEKLRADVDYIAALGGVTL